MTSIVLEVCRENKIHPVEFFGPGRDPRLSRARRIAIFRFKQAGFNTAAIARLIRRNYSTVQYWLYPKYRARRVHYFKQLRAKQAAAK